MVSSSVAVAFVVVPLVVAEGVIDSLIATTVGSAVICFVTLAMFDISFVAAAVVVDSFVAAAAVVDSFVVATGVPDTSIAAADETVSFIAAARVVIAVAVDAVGDLPLVALRCRFLFFAGCTALCCLYSFRAMAG